jgi:sulfite exporter TauE/SafE
MGLVGGPHCLAMCAAPCAAIVSPTASERELSIRFGGRGGGSLAKTNSSRWLGFHLGRLMGYAALGGLAAYAMETVAWFSDRTSLLHPVWVLLHLAALGWGLMLFFQIRQPQWMASTGGAVWSRVRYLVRAPGGSWAAGGLWALLPCGLLYSAVMVSALAGGVWQGALSMFAFGLGGAAWLAAGPWLWLHIRQLKYWREVWGLRIAGALLAAISLWALWLDMVHIPSQWCR